MNLLLYTWLSIRSTPRPVTVTTRIITFLVGNPYKASFAIVTGWGVDPNYPEMTCRIKRTTHQFDRKHQASKLGVNKFHQTAVGTR